MTTPAIDRSCVSAAVWAVEMVWHFAARPAAMADEPAPVAATLSSSEDAKHAATEARIECMQDRP